jgi:lipoprotein-anchoring transpeptidase ErfK/SrfK
VRCLRVVVCVIAGILPAWGQPTPARPIVVGGVFTYAVKRGDSLSLIGARYGIGPAALARQNARALHGVLRPGEPLRIDNRHLAPAGAGATIIINIPQRHLFLFGRDGALRAHYPVGLGRPDWQTPVGAFEVTELERDPTWDVPKSIQDEMRREGKPVIQRMPPCPGNPLGRYWLRLSIGGIGIHGTNAPATAAESALSRKQACCSRSAKSICSRVNSSRRMRTWPPSREATPARLTRSFFAATSGGPRGI